MNACAPAGRQGDGQPISTTTTGTAAATDSIRAGAPGGPRAQVREGDLARQYAELLGAVEVRPEAPRHPADGDGRRGLQLHDERGGQTVDRAFDPDGAER